MLTGFRIGSLAQDAITGIKCLAALPSVANNFMTFETPVGVDYQVPAGKTFIITKLLFWVGDAENFFGISYGDDGVADGAGAPTNNTFMTTWIMGKVTNTQYEIPIFIPIPAEKFPCIKAFGGAVGMNIFGVEV